MAVTRTCDLCGFPIEGEAAVSMLTMDLGGIFNKELPTMSGSHDLHRRCYHDQIHVLFEREDAE
jgi:hypothetical protein